MLESHTINNTIRKEMRASVTVDQSESKQKFFSNGRVQADPMVIPSNTGKGRS
jgi:hypothetical protein